MDETLTWTNHIKIIANKIAKNIGVIRRISYVISPKIRLNLYHTMVSPYMSYGNIRIIGGDSYYAPTNLRFEETKIMKFVNLNKYFTGIFMYKFMNNLVPGSFKNYFVKVADTHRYNTRAAGGLFRQYARTNYRKFAIG